jgi:hypothetical protein
MVRRYEGAKVKKAKRSGVPSCGDRPTCQGVAERRLAQIAEDDSICLYSYFVLKGLSTLPTNRALSGMGFNERQAQVIWETKVRDIDIITWMYLTDGRTKPATDFTDGHGF